ncbi:MAG: sigma-E factor regulatory protein RseB, partial [Hafnia paralvei]
PRREVLLRGNEISYFEPGLEPFTLNGDHIVDALPSIIFSDIKQLRQYYNFISVGRTRVADRPCEVIRIVSRDGLRFSYIVWIDESSKLPLRVDLLDRDGETLEQFRVISFTVGDQVTAAMSSLAQLTLPPLLKLPATDKVDFSWRTSWLPQGFKEVSRSRRTLPTLSEPVESRLYSDGLFSFTVNISSAASGAAVSEQFLRQGRRTIHTETRNNVDITVVGELPPATAKRVANSIVLDGRKS